MSDKNLGSKQILNSLNDIKNILVNSKTISADGTIKVFDHVFNKLGDMLPVHVSIIPSTKFALKASGGASLLVLLIGIIIGVIAYNSAKNSKPQKKITKYDENGNKISESTQTEGDDGSCKKIYKNGKVSTVECLISKGKSNAWKGLIVLAVIIAIVLFVLLFKSIKTWHYTRELRRSNLPHKTLIDYLHTLFNVE